MTTRWQELVDAHRCIYCTEFNIDYHVWNLCPSCARKHENQTLALIMTSIILVATGVVFLFLYVILR